FQSYAYASLIKSLLTFILTDWRCNCYKILCHISLSIIIYHTAKRLEAINALNTRYTDERIEKRMVKVHVAP
ncbi:MAG: hypothetical protein IJK11_00150, partial [Acidaminococcaceae bacterium]|nr:hypothetical protein [Acidaminococcaceae bacterium]MBQ6745279.1 hypothetical protein [Acidaminococcaceae bacterium]